MNMNKMRIKEYINQKEYLELLMKNQLILKKQKLFYIWQAIINNKEIKF